MTKKEKIYRFLLTSIILHIIVFVIMANLVIQQPTKTVIVVDLEEILPPLLVKERKPPNLGPSRFTSETGRDTKQPVNRNFVNKAQLLPKATTVAEYDHKRTPDGLPLPMGKEGTSDGCVPGPFFKVASHWQVNQSKADDGIGIRLASSNVVPDPVKPNKTKVIITRLRHLVSNYHILDNNLIQQIQSLNNDYELVFELNLQQKFSPYGAILLLVGEDSKLAAVRAIDRLSDSFTESERSSLRSYVDSGGILLIVEPTNFGSDGGFISLIRGEMRNIFGDKWHEIDKIIFVKGAFDSNNSSLIPILTNIIQKLPKSMS